MSEKEISLLQHVLRGDDLKIDSPSNISENNLDNDSAEITREKFKNDFLSWSLNKVEEYCQSIVKKKLEDILVRNKGNCRNCAEEAGIIGSSPENRGTKFKKLVEKYGLDPKGF